MRVFRACQALAIVAIVLGVSSIAEAQSGDAIVDGWLIGYDYKAGSNSVPSRLNLNNYPFFNACASGTPADELNCPSDLTYTPGHSGGSQAFGVGVDQYAELWYWVEDCGYHDVWVWNPENGWVLEWQYYCDYYQIHQIAQTAGRLGARIKWSSTPVGALVGTRPLGTVALKSELDHGAGYDAWECDNNLIYGAGKESPCAPWKDNAYIVPDSYNSRAGYEDKIVIQEGTCYANPWRKDDYTDFYNDCFYMSTTGWWSDLPDVYRDTTKYDTVTDFVAGVGTASPAGIIEGHTYGWWAYFGSAGNEILFGFPVKHVASITVDEPLHPVCDGTAPLCQFQVDQTPFNDAFFIYLPWP